MLRAWPRISAGLLAVVGGIGAPGAVSAQPAPAPTDAVLRVVDVGAGLCVVIVVPGGGSMVYDTGRGRGVCLRAVREMIPGPRIDLVVLSHSDADHIREMDEILEAYDVANIVHPGDPRGDTVDAMREMIDSEGAEVWNLSDPATPPAPGRTFTLGAATLTFVAGWGDGHQTEGPGEASLSGGMLHNALSIVMRLEYGGHSVLLTGDTVGRRDFSAPETCQYAERIMSDPGYPVQVKSEVLVGQHHGADNATAGCFVRAVNPGFVIFSAGHQFHHPRQSTVDRLTADGVLPAAIFRTDLGDNEGGTGRNAEMSEGSGECRDFPGDDDVEIRLPLAPLSPASVRYRGPSAGCP